MIRRWLMGWALLLLMPLAVQARLPALEVAVAGRQPVLWKVSDTDSALYLLGTFHALASDDYPPPAEEVRAFDDSTMLLFEVAPAALTAPDTQRLMRRAMIYDEGRNLRDVLPKPMFDRLSALMAASGWDVQTFERSKPWAVSLGLAAGTLQTLGLRTDLGLDRYWMERAAQAGKPVAGLETVEAQLQAMDAVPDAEQVQSLQEFLADPQKAVRELQDLHASWRAGDVAKLDAEMRGEMARKTPESYRLLDVQRNQAWLPQLQQRLASTHHGENTLVVVGALHLLGPDGLVEQLRARGYTIERMCDACPSE
jgi:hypothetical protein